MTGEGTDATAKLIALVTGHVAGFVHDGGRRTGVA